MTKEPEYKSTPFVAESTSGLGSTEHQWVETTQTGVPAWDHVLAAEGWGTCEGAAPYSSWELPQQESWESLESSDMQISSGRDPISYVMSHGIIADIEYAPTEPHDHVPIEPHEYAPTEPHDHVPIDFTSDDIYDMQPEDYVDFTSPLSNSSTPRQELPQTTVVQGKLASCIDFWKNTIHAPESVLSIRYFRMVMFYHLRTSLLRGL